MYFQDLFTPLYVGKVHVDTSVKTAGTKQRGIENVLTVGRRHNDNAFVGFKAVHLDENLVQGLFSFVVTAADTCASASTYGVDFVDEDDARAVLFRKLEQVTNTLCTQADVHFYEVGTRNREEGNARFACYGFCEQGFTRARRAYEQHARRDSCAKRRELFRSFKEFHDFLQLFLFFFCACNVRETGFHVVLYLRFALAHIHSVVLRIGCATHHEPEQKGEQQDTAKGKKGGQETAFVGIGEIRDGANVCADAVIRQEQREIFVVINARTNGNIRFNEVAFFVVNLTRPIIRVYVQFINFACADLIDKLLETNFRSAIKDVVNDDTNDNRYNNRQNNPKNDFCFLSQSITPSPIPTT